MTVAHLAEQRAAQGLPPTVEDPAVLAKVAAIVLGDGEGAPHRNGAPSELPSTTFPAGDRHDHDTPTG